jgi:quinol monooxygenase YgiN
LTLPRSSADARRATADAHRDIADARRATNQGGSIVNYRRFGAPLALCLALSAATLLPGANAQAPAQNPSASAAGNGPPPTCFVVKFKVKAGQNAAFEKMFLGAEASVRNNEPGNVQYDLYRDAQDPQMYVVIEHYKDAAAVRAHRQSLGKVFANLGSLTEGRPSAMGLVFVSSK